MDDRRRLEAARVHVGAGPWLGFDEFQPGTATITLDNRDRAYDPANTSGAHYGDLLPRKRCDMKATISAVTYDVFDMHINSYPQRWDGLMGTVELPCTDAFAIFNRETFATALEADPDNESQFRQAERAAERTDQRVGWLLDAADWPAGRRTLSTGVITAMAHRYPPMNVLGHMRDMETTEGGFLFMDAAGNVVFQDKYFRLNNYASSAGTFSDSPTGSERPFVASEPEQDVEHLVNHATGRQANTEGGVTYETNDTASRTAYGPAAHTVEMWTASRPRRSKPRTMYWVDRYSDPLDSIKSITLYPQMDDNLWAHALGR